MRLRNSAQRIFGRVDLPWVAQGADLNPIKQVFSKLKHRLDTWRGIGTLIDHFNPAACSNYFRHAGHAYEQTQRALGTTTW